MFGRTIGCTLAMTSYIKQKENRKLNMKVLDGFCAFKTNFVIRSLGIGTGLCLVNFRDVIVVRFHVCQMSITLKIRDLSAVNIIIIRTCS